MSQIHSSPIIGSSKTCQPNRETSAMANKCSQCSKPITRKYTGLECNKCGVVVHSTNACTGLTNKQLSSLRTADNLEWTCNECSRSPRRSSIFIAPDDDHDDEEDAASSSNGQLDMKKLLRDLTEEINKIIKKELKETNSALQYCSDKLEECLDCMEAFKEKIKSLEKKNCELENKYRSLENNIGALQQRVHEFEQKDLRCNIEVAGIPYIENENVQDIAGKIARTLNKETSEIKTVKRIPTQQGKTGIIKMQMHSEEKRNNWIKEAKLKNITVNSIITGSDSKIAKEKIYLREELTYYNKNLLWKTKQACKDKYKFVWCKEGKIMVRKTENSKVLIIRSDEDINKLTT